MRRTQNQMLKSTVSNVINDYLIQRDTKEPSFLNIILVDNDRAMSKISNEVINQLGSSGEKILVIDFDGYNEIQKYGTKISWELNIQREFNIHKLNTQSFLEKKRDVSRFLEELQSTELGYSTIILKFSKKIFEGTGNISNVIHNTIILFRKKNITRAILKNIKTSIKDGWIAAVVVKN